MLLKTRKVRRSSKFTPRWVAAARRKKEQAASYYSTAAIQLVLFFFLVIGAYRSYMAITLRASGLSLLERMAVPGFFLIAALFMLRAGIRNIREAVEVRRIPDDSSDAY
jgi:hypothetical protein